MNFYVPRNRMPVQRATAQKILLVMKMSCILLLIALHVSAKSVSQMVSYSGENVALTTVFKEIKKQTGMVFVYKEDMLQQAHAVSIQAQNMPLTDFLDQLLKDQLLKYSIESKTIIISRKNTSRVIIANDPNLLAALQAAPPGDVRGRVLGPDGKPVAEAFISAKKLPSSEGIITNVNGDFYLRNVEPDDTLLVSSVNIEAIEVPVKGRDSILIRVKYKIAILDSVGITVNTGYQKLSKERATGSFSKPDMQIFSRRTGSMDLITRLEGLIPGMQIGTGPNDIDLSADGTTTRKSLIRGPSSVRAQTSPLYVVNGVAVANFNAVNLDDIEDITVLKDAAAAAIWGARSANGVVVINTKSGNKYQKLSVNYSGFVSYSGKPVFSDVHMLNSRQYIDLAKTLFNMPGYLQAYPYASQTFLAPHDQILYAASRGLISQAVANQKLDSLAAIDNISQIEDLWYRSSISTNHTVSVSGGNGMYSFYGSLGYTGGQSPTPGAQNNTYRINLTQSINTSRVRLSLNASLVNTITSSKNPITVTNSFLPYQLFQDASGNNLNINYMNGYLDSVSRNYASRSGISLDYNPLNEMNYAWSKSNLLSINVTANTSVRLWKGLNFLGTYGYQRAPGTVESYWDHKSLTERKTAISLTVTDPTLQYMYPITGGRFTTGNTDTRSWTVRNQLMYDAPVRHNKDRISLQAGQEVQEARSTKTVTTVLGYDDAMGTYSILDYATLQGGVFPTVTGFGALGFSPYDVDKTVTRFISYFGLASYTFNNKYSLDASVRKDLSSLFASEVSSQNKPAWSFGAKWRLTQEKFISDIKWINSLNLRVTYGITGNSPVFATPQYDIVSNVSSSSSFFYNVISGDGLTVSSVGNKTLAWERTANINIGLDYAILNGRLSGGFDFYKKTTTDMIGNTQLNPLTGYSNITGNLGKMTNTGLEVSLSSVNIKTKDFNWTTSLTLGYNTNKLLSFAKPTSAALTITNRMAGVEVVGYPLHPMWAYQFAGLDTLGDPKIYLADKSVTKAPNVAKIADLKYMGTTTPRFSGGFANSFSYKSLGLRVNMIYNMGSVMRMPVNTFYSGRLASSGSFSGGNIRDFFYDRWQKKGDEAFTNVPSYVPSSTLSAQRRNVGYYASGDINVESASYIKIRDISLSYDLSPKLLQSLKIQRISVFGQVTNFLVWAANSKGYDPEFAGGYRPFLHNYSVGVNLSF